MHPLPPNDICHTRGPDGFLAPYTATEVCAIVNETATALRPRRVWRRKAVTTDLALEIYRVPNQPFTLGPGLHWLLWRTLESVVGCGYFERDLEWEAETKTAAWVEQAAFLVPSFQGQGWYPQVLTLLTQLTPYSLLPDTQQTRANARAWEKWQTRHHVQ